MGILDLDALQELGIDDRVLFGVVTRGLGLIYLIFYLSISGAVLPYGESSLCCALLNTTHAQSVLAAFLP